MEKTTRASPSCRSRAAGPTSAPGTRSGELSDKDEQGNAAHGTGRVRGFPQLQYRPDRQARWWRSKASTISSLWRPQDAVLVSRQKDANGLKRLVTKLKMLVAPKVTERSHQGAPALGQLISRSINGDRHQVKRIVVKAGPAAVAAEALPPFGALDRGARHRSRHYQRCRQDGA